MNKNPLISIIIPCYNASKWIKETIYSVIKQSYNNWELLIIDDGSTDNSAEIISEFIDIRIKYFYIKNSGVAYARNYGVNKSNGLYLAFLDADDLFLEDNLYKKVLFLTNHNFKFVHSDVIIQDNINNNNEIKKSCITNPLKQLLEFSELSFIPPSNVIMTREIFDEVNGFDINLSTSADWDLWVRIANKTEFGYISEPLIIYRLYPNQMHKNIELMEKDMLYAFQKLRKSNIFKSKKYFNYCLSKLYLILAGSYSKYSNNKLKFIKYLILSFITNPIWVFKKISIL